MRRVDSFESEDDCRAATLAYAEMLLEEGWTGRYGVCARYLTGSGWTVLLVDREPHRPPERPRRVVHQRPWEGPWD